MAEWEKMLEKRASIRSRGGPFTEAQRAVYFSSGWEDWQRFRISLKGESIEEKLERLEWYLRSSDRSNDEYIRVYNYLGALLRGGFEEARPLFNKVGGGM